MQTSRARSSTLATVLMAIACLLTLSGRAAADTGADVAWTADDFPNVPLLTQKGKPVRFYDDLIKGKVVAINFIFTACSAACPMETARLREVKQILGGRVGRDVHFYSISIDPLIDTPETLRQYADKFDVGSGWTFLTGKPEDIMLLRRKLGVYSPDPAGDGKNHDLTMIVGNQKNGAWKKVSPFENPYVLANQIGSWLPRWKEATRPHREDAGAVASAHSGSRGEALFRGRCAACHSVGADEKAQAALRRVGPDLGGVTRARERPWLMRWLKEPDRMLAEKDPLATALLERYKVAMPNLRLSEADIAALLDYLDAAGNPPADADQLARR